MDMTLNQTRAVIITSATMNLSGYWNAVKCCWQKRWELKVHIGNDKKLSKGTDHKNIRTFFCDTTAAEKSIKAALLNITFQTAKVTWWYTVEPRSIKMNGNC
jgi:hypothetical protein